VWAEFNKIRKEYTEGSQSIRIYAEDKTLSRICYI